MARAPGKRPHLLGIDDGPFEKHETGASTPIVAVMMEGADLIEAVATTRFPVDGPLASEFLADWVASLRIRPSLQGVVLGGMTLAGLAVVDVGFLAERLDLPVMVVNRRVPRNEPLVEALRAAGFDDRIAIVERAPASRPCAGLHASCAGVSPAHAEALLRASIGKSDLPEPLRVAHLIARALVTGESRGKP